MWLLVIILVAFLIYYFWARKYIFVNKGKTDIEKVNREFIVDQLGIPSREWTIELHSSEYSSYMCFDYVFNRSTIRIDIPTDTYILSNVDVIVKDNITKENVLKTRMNINTLKEYMNQVKDYV